MKTPLAPLERGILGVLLMFSVNISAKTQSKETPSMAEYLSNVVLFNPTFIHMHETEGKMTHDIMASGRWKFKIEFKNRNQDAVFSLYDDQNKPLCEIIPIAFIF